MDIGVIGVGVMGRNHLRVYSEMKAVDSVSVFDINTIGAEEAAKATGANAYKTLDKMLSRVDAVSVCVPTPYHFSVAKEVIGKGIPVLIEKPICQNAEEARKLVDMIPKGSNVGVGHIERFNPVVSEIMRILKNPLYIEIKRHNPASSRVVGSSVVEDLMIHDIDLVFNLLFDGESTTMHSEGNGDLCTALFNFGNVPVYLSASRKSSKKIRMIYIEEEDLTIEGDLMTQEIFVYRKPNQYSMDNQRYVQDNIIEKVLINKKESLKVELDTFVQCVRNDRQFPITPGQALRNMQICDQIMTQTKPTQAHKIPVAA
jgi:predicted dehydrogenase